MAKKSDGKSVTIVLRTTPDIKASVAKAAAAENRSVSNWLDALVRGALSKPKVTK
jgi:uncharacterized protein (DUF1778 family)